MKFIATSMMLICSMYLIQAQTYYGQAAEKYSGIVGASFNPALIAGSPYAADVMLFSANASFGNDYIAIDYSEVFGSDFDFDENAERVSGSQNNFIVDINTMLPSVMFNINERSSIGLISKIRGMSNANNIDGRLFEEIEENFTGTEDFTVSSKDLSLTTNVWLEIGVAYGYVLKNTDKEQLSVGGTVKYLAGVGGGFYNSERLDAAFDASAPSLTTSGDLSYGASPNFDGGNEVSFDELASGLGLDLGVAYTAKTDDGYKWRAGASLNDIGKIKYDNVRVTRYDINVSVSTENFEEDNTENNLENNYTETKTLGDESFALPTAAHLFADYSLSDNLYLGFQSEISLRSNSSERGNRIYSYATVSPRWEKKWFGVSVPLTLQQSTGFSIGTGLKLGPLLVGSSTILTNLLSDSSKAADVYVAARIPIFKKKNTVTSEEE